MRRANNNDRISCSSLTSISQKIARAIKWALDGFIASEEEKEERALDEEKPELSIVPDRGIGDGSIPPSICPIRPVRESMETFRSGLKLASHICFRAIRPSNASLLDYLETDNEQSVIPNVPYVISDICLCGSKPIQVGSSWLVGALVCSILFCFISWFFFGSNLLVH